MNDVIEKIATPAPPMFKRKDLREPWSTRFKRFALLVEYFDGQNVIERFKDGAAVFHDGTFFLILPGCTYQDFGGDYSDFLADVGHEVALMPPGLFTFYYLNMSGFGPSTSEIIVEPVKLRSNWKKELD